MSKPVLHIFHADPAARASPEAKAFNDQIDGLVKSGMRVTTCIGIAQTLGVEAALTARGLALESAATAFPRFAAEGATVVSF